MFLEKEKRTPPVEIIFSILNHPFHLQSGSLSLSNQAKNKEKLFLSHISLSIIIVFLYSKVSSVLFELSNSIFYTYTSLL